MPNSVKARKAPKECEDPKVDEEVFKKIRERGRRALTWHNMPKSGILLVTGFRGEGKTALSWWIADTLHQVQGYPRQVVAYGLHPDAMAALPKWARNSASSPAEVSTLTKPSIIVVDEATVSNGCLHIVPESHKLGNLKAQRYAKGKIEDRVDVAKAVPMEGSPGDVVMFRCEVWHRGTSNRSSEDRYLLQVHYAKRMITQKFPPYLNKFQFDPHIIASCTPRQRRLLGEHSLSNYD